MNEIKLEALYENEPIHDILVRAGVNFDLPCGGNHTCGKCKIKVRGNLSAISPSEAAMLSDSERAAGMRMACFAKAMGDIFITLPERTGQQILAGGVAELSVHNPMMPPERYGVAIDIGTTTVVCSLYGHDGVSLGTVSELNSQQRFGADVISRINHGILHGNDDIHKAIVTQLEKMLLELSAKVGVMRSAITNAVVTGNTTMLHFFAGLDPKGTGFAPFTPQSLFNLERSDILEGISVYLPPCVSAYVGADLVCCVLASKMCERGDTALIVDIGTNGEMALLYKGMLYCCSTAAGPAFEGAGISQGMIAASGAISHVRYDIKKKAVVYETIGNAPAKGICGSGVIDTIALLLEQGAMLPSGLLETELPEGHPMASMMWGEEADLGFTFPNSKVSLIQADVRKIQLAKAAIYSGIITMAQICGLDMKNLEVFYLCGGFGSFLNLTSAEVIGLTPENSKDITVVLGNAAIMGAAMVLLDSRLKDKASEISDRCHYIELSDSADFMDNYVASMSFAGEEDF